MRRNGGAAAYALQHNGPLLEPECMLRLSSSRSALVCGRRSCMGPTAHTWEMERRQARVELQRLRKWLDIS
eukprot:530304-Pleurochrysis_carterae.AAC.1